MNRNLVSLRVRQTRQQGFSLIELMVTIVVAAVLLAIAIPGFGNLILSNKLTTVTNEWVTAVNVARSEAIKRNAPVVICGSAGTDNGLSDGCNDAAKLGEVRAYKAGTTDVTVVREALATDMPARITLSDTASIRFAGNGIGTAPGADAPFTGVVAQINAPDLHGGTSRCIQLESGTAVVTQDGVCP